MKKIITVLFCAVLICCFFSGCGDENNGGEGGNSNSRISTSDNEPSKDELSAEDFEKRLNGVSDITFVTETKDDKKDLSMFPYQGLEACVMVSKDNVNIATFFVFDSDENAKKIIEDSKRSNSSDYKEETGKNFDKIQQGSVVIEQVGKTVVTITSEDKTVTDTILEVTGY
ncbi:MAG: hypothetical protein ACI4RI_07060 [Ruminococcus sp.]